MLVLPRTIADIDKLIADQVQESIHLDYKSSQAIDDRKFDEFAKDISAFANSDGGLIIYGVQEKDHLPLGKDSGVDHLKYSRERIEDIITSRVAPRLDLSVSTLRNLKHLLAEDEQLERIDPSGCDYRVFMEVLGVDRDMASSLNQFFWRGNGRKGLSDIEGITDEMIENIERHFILVDKNDEE